MRVMFGPIVLQTKEGVKHHLRLRTFTTQVTDRGFADNFYEEEFGQEHILFDEIGFPRRVM